MLELGGLWKHQNNNPACTKSFRTFRMLKLDTVRKKKEELLETGENGKRIWPATCVEIDAVYVVLACVQPCVQIDAVYVVLACVQPCIQIDAVYVVLACVQPCVQIDAVYVVLACVQPCVQIDAVYVVLACVQPCVLNLFIFCFSNPCFLFLFLLLRRQSFQI